MAAATPKAAVSSAKSAKKASFGGRAWRLLRLAVLWARKGSAVHSLRLLKTLRRSGLGHGLGGGRNDRLRYGEREFSIDETPAFRFRTPSARVLRFIPCMAPAVPDTPGFYSDDRYFFAGARDRDADCAGYYGYDGEPSECGGVESPDDGVDEQLLERATVEASRANVDAAAEEGGVDAGVDVKAEEFIAKFYAQMKLQRQISWLQYNEMMERSIC